MKKRFITKPIMSLTAFVLTFSMILFSGGILNVYAAGPLEEVAVIDFDPETTVEPNGEVELFSDVTVKFNHECDIESKETDIDKEAIVLFDSSYKSTLIPSIYSGILKTCLYTLNDLTVQGSGTQINGDIFVRETLILKDAEVRANGKVRYQKEGGHIPISSFGDNVEKMTEAEAHANDDKLVSDDEGNFRELFDALQDEVLGGFYPDSERAKYIFNTDTSDIHFPDGSTECRFDEETPGLILSKSGSGENTKYKMVGAPFTLRENMYFEGDLQISVPSIHRELKEGNIAPFIYATGDIVLQGIGAELSADEDSIENLILLSRGGDIRFESGNTSIKAIAFAPNGNITIQGDNIDFQGSFIANNIESIAGYSDIKGPSGDQIKEFPGTEISTDGFESVRDSLKKISEQFDDKTRVGVIQYSDFATVGEGWRFYDNKTEKAELEGYVESLAADTDSENSNLGDAMRKALSVFNSDLSNPDAEKFIIVFTGLLPNAYSSNHYVGSSYVLDIDQDISINNVTKDDEAAPGFSANGYVKEMIKKIDAYNDGNKANIHTILVDLSRFRQDSNLNDDDIPREIIDPLTQLAASLGFTLGGEDVEGDDVKIVGEMNAYYRPTKEQVEEPANVKFIIKRLADYTKEFKKRLAVEDLNIQSAEIEINLPESLKPTKFVINNVMEEDLTLTEGPYTLTHTVENGCIPKFVKLTPRSRGKYKLEASEVSITLFVNNADGTFKGNTPDLKVKEDLVMPPAKITYKLKDKYGDEFEHVLEFDKVTIPAFYNKDIN